MTPNEYQALALRTEHTPAFVRLGHGADHDLMVARLLHGCLGLVSEVGEIADALKKHIIYGAELDKINVLEEVGDVAWYQALLLSAIKQTMEEAMTKNIAKLKARYGAAFTAEAAQVRDLAAERRVLEE